MYPSVGYHLLMTLPFGVEILLDSFHVPAHLQELGAFLSLSSLDHSWGACTYCVHLLYVVDAARSRKMDNTTKDDAVWNEVMTTWSAELDSLVVTKPKILCSHSLTAVFQNVIQWLTVGKQGMAHRVCTARRNKKIRAN